MTFDLLVEIHGFATPGEYRQFEEQIEAPVLSGEWIEIPPDPDYGPGEIYGGRWFKNKAGAVWRLIEPDFPFKGLWQKVTN